MAAKGEYLNKLTLENYAQQAFLVDADGAASYAPRGGVYAGTGSRFDNPTTQDVKGFAPRARLATATVGRVFVRWVGSQVLEKSGWISAARGAWWATDALADEIVQEAATTPGGDTSDIARRALNVGYFKSDGSVMSDMKAVIVCRIEQPVQILLGVGRPVTSNRPAGGGGRLKETWDSRAHQAIILTTWEGQFHGQEFLRPLYFNSSVAFTTWWTENNLFRIRRARLLDNAQRKQQGLTPAPPRGWNR